jgi:aminomethyltransferase
VSIGTALHARTAALNRKQNWREWSGYLAASAYADSSRAEYNAIRQQAALIDVSPLYKYGVAGRRVRLIDRVITATRPIKPGQRVSTCWFNEAGKVLDDVARSPASTTTRSAGRARAYFWIGLNSRGA